MQVPDKGVIELRAYYTWMGVDGIVRTKVKKNAEVHLEDAKENSIAVNSFHTYNEYALIIDTSEIKSITKEARNHFSMNGRKSNVVCFAIIISSPLSAVVGNFFMGLNKPRVPARLFTKESEAILWCESLTKELIKND